MEVRVCSLCSKELLLGCFHKGKSRCKRCRKIETKAYREKYREKISQKRKEEYIKNIEKYKINSKQYYANNKEKIIKNSKLWQTKNMDHRKQYMKNYYINNFDKIKEYKKNYKNCNMQYKISCNLRSRLSSALKNKRKYGSAVKDVGCSVGDLILWLEQQFQVDMTWENYGEWHVDHIIPLSNFDLEDKTQFIKACHWFNLRPLWAKENLSRSKNEI